MSETKWTPGPWHYRKAHDQGDGFSDFEIFAENESAWDLAHVQDDGDAGRALANARLIARAPDLAEALRRLLDATDSATCETYVATTALGVAERAARALLAEIEGGRNG